MTAAAPPGVPLSPSCSLVTGVTGFVGSHLADALLARGETVVGVSRVSTWPPGATHLAPHVQTHTLELSDVDGVAAVLAKTNPARIYHLAGYASTGMSFKEPDEAWAGNLTATRRLYDAVLRWGGRPRILFVGSGLVYGESAEAPTEDAPFCPASPYASSKASADLVSYQVTREHGLHVVRARPFNHVGPRQAPGFALASFARQVATIAAGRAEPVLHTGDLRPARDLTDVRDVVTAYLLLQEHGRPGEAYNVASGVSWTMQEVLDRLIALAGVRVEVRSRADLLRPTDQLVVRANADKLRRETGWTPAYTLDRTLGDLLDYWKAQNEPGR